MALTNQEHKAQLENIVELQSVIEKLNKRKPGKTEWRELERFLGFFTGYAQKHFSGEEALMRKHNVPGFKAHSNEHIHFTKKIEELGQQLLKEKQAFLAVDLNFFIQDWFLYHTARTDMEYAEFFKQRGVS